LEGAPLPIQIFKSVLHYASIQGSALIESL
jgi:hypothetical protein